MRRHERAAEEETRKKLLAEHAIERKKSEARLKAERVHGKY